MNILEIDKYAIPICLKWGYTLKAIKSKNRQSSVAWVRHLVTFCVYKEFNLTSKEVGKYLKRDHSTILNSIYKVLNDDNLFSYAQEHLKKEVVNDKDAFEMIQCVNPYHPMGNIITYNG